MLQFCYGLTIFLHRMTGISIRYDFDKPEKDTCVNSSGMNAIFDISYNFRLTVKFSTHMMNIYYERKSRVQLYFRSIVVLVFTLTTTLNKFRFHSLRNKMINLVLLIKYHFDFRLEFDIYKKVHFRRFE